jgi:hypothetical protein
MASDLSSPGLDRLPHLTRTANSFARAISGREGAVVPLPLEGEGGGATTPDLWGRGVATLAERRAAADAAGGEGRARQWEALEDTGEEEGAWAEPWRRGGSFARARPPVPAGHPGSFSPSPVERSAGRAASGALVELVSGGSPVLSPSSPASRRARSTPAPPPSRPPLLRDGPRTRPPPREAPRRAA